ncbi:TPA: TetR/AcrR family transcriptional regulator [Salmonella enterica]|nr:TetR/AcrR family transcriptional regulator [Salmonella enterica]
MNSISTGLKNTRFRILKAARKNFSEKGFHGASMKAICKECELSPGTLYHYFPSKEALIQAIILEDQERATLHFEKPLKDIGLIDYLIDSTIKVSKEDCSQRALVTEIMAEAMRNHKVSDMLKHKYETIIKHLISRFDDAQKEKEICRNIDKEFVARLLLVITYGILSDSESDKYVCNDRFIQTFKDMLNGLFKVSL